MAATTTFHEGAMVRCPQCGADVHVSECTGDPERQFRCDRCRERNGEMAKHLVASSITKGVVKNVKGKSNRDVQGNATSPSGSRSGNRTPESESIDADVDDDALDQPSVIG